MQLNEPICGNKRFTNCNHKTCSAKVTNLEFAIWIEPMRSISLQARLTAFIPFCPVKLRGTAKRDIVVGHTSHVDQSFLTPADDHAPWRYRETTRFAKACSTACLHQDKLGTVSIIICTERNASRIASNKAFRYLLIRFRALQYGISSDSRLRSHMSYCHIPTSSYKCSNAKVPCVYNLDCMRI